MLPGFTRSACGLFMASLVAFVALGTLIPSPVEARVAADEADWKTVLPEAEMTKIVDDCAKIISDATKSALNLKTKGKVAENEAYVLVICAQAGMDMGGDMAQKATALQDTALALAAAIKDQNLKDAQSLAAKVSKFKSMKPEAGNGKPMPLNQAVPIGNLMKEVQDVNKQLEGFKRLSASAFTEKGKPEQITTTSYKMAALTMAITAHVPAKDEGKKTKKLWLESTAECREALLEMAAAAKAKKAKEFKDGWNKMDAACTKCHTEYREKD